MDNVITAVLTINSWKKPMEGKAETPQHMNSANIAYIPLALLRQGFTASKIRGYSEFNKDVSKDSDQQQH